jgi:hypothetical protein
MSKPDLSPELLALLEKVQGKRSRVVVDHILAHGFITTEELENTYGYSHPPRAIRDVREQGIPLESFRVKNEQGRTIAAYRFGDLLKIEAKKFGGRKTFSKLFKHSLFMLQEGRCAVCHTLYEERYLQIDHRIPYEVSGDKSTEQQTDFILLCSSCNRAKAWSCQACENGNMYKNPDICQKCYWANPLSYEHIAMSPIRRIELVFMEEELNLFEQVRKKAEQAQIPVAAYILRLLRNLPSN